MADVRARVRRVPRRVLRDCVDVVITASSTLHLSNGTVEPLLRRSTADPDRYLLDMKDGGVLVTAYGTLPELYGFVAALARCVKGWQFAPVDACEGSAMPETIDMVYVACEPPEPGTPTAEFHCGHWDDDDGPCCWCGSDSDAAACAGSSLPAEDQQ